MNFDKVNKIVGTGYKEGLMIVDYDKKEFDCAGLVSEFSEDFKLIISAYKDGKFKNHFKGTIKDLESLNEIKDKNLIEEGDIIMFKNKNSRLWRHVGIAISRYEFMHTSEENGAIVESISNMYFYNKDLRIFRGDKK